MNFIIRTRRPEASRHRFTLQGFPAKFWGFHIATR
jgi:hypothetical protein